MIETKIESRDALYHDHDYLNDFTRIMMAGHDREDRTGTGTRSFFGLQHRYDFGLGFPLLVSKRVFWKGVLAELRWFLRGETNIRSLQAQGVHIWDEWADKNGDLGPVYGSQWRDFNGVDQIEVLIDGIKNNPYSRRHIVSAWNPAEVPDMALPPCHTMFQFYVTTDGALWCQLYQRSADWFLGVPFNIASYSLLTALVAHKCGLRPGGFIHVVGDAHVYSNHREAFARQEKQYKEADRLNFWTPGLIVSGDPDEPMQNFKVDLVDYSPMPAIKAKVAV